MTTSYLPYEPRQQQLLPSALQDWLPEGHLAYFVSDTIDALDLSAFHARYAAGGPRNQPFHPTMMVKVLVYGYATGVFSSRKIARKLHEDVAFRVLGAGNFPRHRTICDFRALHLEEFSALFVQVVKLAREGGLAKLGTIAVDGTRIKANASRHKAMSYERMQRTELELTAQIEALLARAKATDEAEKNEPELDIPAEMARRENRLEVIRAAREQARADCCGGNTCLNERGAFPVPCRVWTRIPALAPDAGRALRSTLTGQDKESAVAEHTARDESLTAEELAAIKERRSGTDIPRLVAAYNDAVAAADALNSDVTFFVSLLERTLGFMEGVARVCDVEGANTKEALMAEVHRARAALTVPQEKQQENT